MSRYAEIANPNVTPPTEKAKPSQVINHAGGAVFDTGPWKQLDRFLILGAIGATYYATERKMVKDNVEALTKCLAEDGVRVVNRIVEISVAGRAPKNDPAIFALAVAAGVEDPKVRKAALDAVPKVCRTGTHLFQFVEDVTKFRRWGRSLRTAIADWYLERSPKSLAMQAIKYQQRGGWSHGDLLRLTHPVASSPAHDAIFRWMVGGMDAVKATDRKRKGQPVGSLEQFLPSLIVAMEQVKEATTAKDVVKLITEYGLPREAIPTQWLNDVSVWEAMLPTMGLTALIRNLGKMSSIDMFKPLSSSLKLATERLVNGNAIRDERVHPMQFLLATAVYKQGRGVKGSLAWSPNARILDALNDGFYEAFQHVEPTGKNTFLALDVSGSMDCGTVAGAPGVTPRMAAAAMAMVTVRVEKNWHMMGFSHHLVDIPITKSDSLETVMQKMDSIPMGGTDCTLPMLYAAGENLEVDVFQVYTDNETYMGRMHPFQALKAYRSKSGRNAKLAVVGLTATNFTIADPSDHGMLDVVGMDAATPAIMADFARE